MCSQSFAAKCNDLVLPAFDGEYFCQHDVAFKKMSPTHLYTIFTTKINYVIHLQKANWAVYTSQGFTVSPTKISTMNPFIDKSTRNILRCIKYYVPFVTLTESNALKRSY
mmetsp:Transcript_10128/g.15544  ORF Transcript_10128/g.15544 Transcript_10128/m.15544 type:complete len:110 (-) Transcript_10128:918-1247(-)